MRSLPVILALSLAAPLLAQDRPPERFNREMPFDVRTALGAIRNRYQSDRIHESIDIALRVGAANRTETITLRLEPRADTTPPDFQLTLADYLIWSADDDNARVIRIMHALDLQRFYQFDIPDTATPLKALESRVPTVPLPQLHFAYSTDPMLADAFPYTSDIDWTRAVLGELGSVGAILITGNAPDGALLRMITGISASVVSETELRYPDDRITLRTTSTLLQPPESSALGRPVDSLQRVDTIGELAPRLDDLTIGDTLPPRALGPADNKGQRLVLLAREWNDQVAAAITELRAAASTHTFRFEVLLAADIDSASNIAERIAAWQDLAAPTPVRYATSPRITIDRFASQATAVGVLIDDSETIRAIRTLPPITQAAGAPDEEAPATWSSWLDRALAPAEQTPE